MNIKSEVVTSIHASRSSVLSSNADSLASAIRHISQQRSLSDLATITIKHLVLLLPDFDAQCVFHDNESKSLWREGESDEWQSDQGLVGYVARTKKPLCVSNASSNPLYDKTIDPISSGRETNLAMHPLSGYDGNVNAILVLVADNGVLFTSENLFLLEFFSQRVELVFEAVSLEQIGKNSEASENLVNSVFDANALQAYREGNLYGEPIIYPSLGWKYSYLVYIGVLVALLVYASITRINVYASGDGIIMSSDLIHVAAPYDGVVELISVRPGQQVKKGELLISMAAHSEYYQLANAETYFKSMLLARLGDPANADLEENTAAALSTLNEKYRAYKERSIIAPEDGVVEAISAAEGQRIEKNKGLISLNPEGGVLSVVGAVPSRFLPMLEIRQSLSLSLKGYPGFKLDTQVDNIGNVITESAVTAITPTNVMNTLSQNEAHVVIKGSLPTVSFTHRNSRYQIQNGMPATIDILLRKERIIVEILPFLRAFRSS